MKQDEFFKIVGILIVCFFIIYMVVKMFHLQTSVIEGLTNATETDSLDTTGTTSTTSTTTGTTPSSGEAGNSSSYAAAIKAQTIKLQDELLVSKYRKDYESAIINLDDYIGYLMIKQTLNMKSGGDMKSNLDSIGALNILKSAKDSLNATMSFLDKQ